jgi:DNA mismatch endonuclease (patch repair protein)
VDIFTEQKRSEIMSAVKCRDNKSTELKFRNLFESDFNLSLGKGSEVYGKPDFLLAELRIAIFIDGSFWHGHPKKNAPDQ